MGAERKQLGKISYVTDTDVPYYEIGETEGAFQEEDLKSYIKKFGHKNLCATLGYMQFQVIQAVRELNIEMTPHAFANESKPNN